VAPVPAPGPEAPKPLVGSFDQLPAGVVPPGAVPAPQMLHDDYNNIQDHIFRPHGRDEMHQIAQPVLPGPFQGGFVRRNEPEDDDQKKAVGAAPPEQKLWHRGEEIEEEDDHRGDQGMFQHYKEEEAERGAGHWNGGNHHLPEGERHEDLQLEDHDEDGLFLFLSIFLQVLTQCFAEGDDDVDQIDYGNDVVNNNNLHGAKQKPHRKLPQVNCFVG